MEETKVDSWSPSGKTSPGPGFAGLPALRANKEGHFLADPATLGYTGDLERRRIHPNL